MYKLKEGMCNELKLAKMILSVKQVNKCNNYWRVKAIRGRTETKSKKLLRLQYWKPFTFENPKIKQQKPNKLVVCRSYGYLFNEEMIRLSLGHDQFWAKFHLFVSDILQLRGDIQWFLGSVNWLNRAFVQEAMPNLCNRTP
jgi:hypothetical protein